MSTRPRLFVDLAPLRESRDYRLLFVGQVISFPGREFTRVLIPYQVWELTHSSFAVGMVGLVSFLSLSVVALIAGPIVDRHERTRLYLLSQSMLAGAALLLAVNAHLDQPRLWAVYLGAMLSVGIAGFDLPARNAITPNVVPRAQLAQAAALNQVMVNGGKVIGPALGGLVVARYGVSVGYTVDVVTYLPAIVAISMIRRIEPPAGQVATSARAAVVEALRFIRDAKVLLASYLMDVNANVFGMPQALFPAIATEVLGGGVGTYGLLSAAPGIGALVGAVLSGFVGRVRHFGRAVVGRWWCGGSRLPSSGCRSCSWSRWSCWRWPDGPTWCRPSSAAPSSRSTYPTRCGAAPPASSPSSCRAAPAWATPRRGSWPPWSPRSSRWCPAAWPPPSGPSSWPEPSPSSSATSPTSGGTAVPERHARVR